MKKAAKCLAVEIVVCTFFAVLPALLTLWPQDIMTALSLISLYVLYPLCALIAPLKAVLHGGSPFLCAVTPFLLFLTVMLLQGLMLPAAPASLSLLLAVLGANIGAEIRKRSPKDQK